MWSKKLFERAFEADLAPDRLHLAADRRDLSEPEVVNLVGGEAGGGRAFQLVGVIGRAIGQVPRAEIAFRLGSISSIAAMSVS